MRKLIKIALIALTTASAVAIPLVNASPASADTTNTPVILEFTGSPNPFWPTVRDGYKDGVRFSGQSAKLLILLTSHGRSSSATPAAGRSPSAPASIRIGETESAWYWSGKDLNGNPVSAGTYTATFIVTNLETGQRATAAQTLTAKSETTYKRITRPPRRRGHQLSKPLGQLLHRPGRLRPPVAGARLLGWIPGRGPLWLLSAEQRHQRDLESGRLSWLLR